VKRHGVRVSFPPLMRASRIAEGGGVLTFLTLSTNNFGTGGPGHEQLGPLSTTTALSDLLGVSKRTTHRWIKEGIPIDYAEDFAFMLGSHPATIWGDEWLFAAGCPLAAVLFSPTYSQGCSSSDVPAAPGQCNA
jgi:hypothetical protein